MSSTGSLYLALFAAGFLATYAWRFIAVLAVSRLNPQSEILQWVRAVATALVAGLVMRLIFAPAGVLAETSLLARFLAMAAGLSGFFLFRRNVEIGVALAVVLVALITFAGI